jgi:hypothetical protein
MTIRIAKLVCTTCDTAVCVLSGMLKLANALLSGAVTKLTSRASLAYEFSPGML